MMFVYFVLGFVLGFIFWWFSSKGISKLSLIMYWNKINRNIGL